MKSTHASLISLLWRSCMCVVCLISRLLLYCVVFGSVGENNMNCLMHSQCLVCCRCTRDVIRARVINARAWCVASGHAVCAAAVCPGLVDPAVGRALLCARGQRKPKKKRVSCLCVCGICLCFASRFLLSQVAASLGPEATCRDVSVTHPFVFYFFLLPVHLSDL